MKIVSFAHPGEPYSFEACGLILGNFDGVHRGHRALISELKRLNGERATRLPLGAFCFETPPAAHFGHAAPQLCDNAEKFALLREAGLQFVVLADFPTLRHLSPEDFVINILIGDCRCRLAVCGYNYTFGEGGAGKAEDLARWLGTRPGCTVSVVPPVTDGQTVISSSVIRQMLERGHPEDATRLLGRPYALSGKVANGRRVGRTMGFPTANLAFPAGRLIPAHGVYAVTARQNKRTFFGLANVGTHPTFGDGEDVTCEVFLFDFSGDLYGKTLQVSFLHFLRPERAFPSADALRAQIEKDVLTAKEYFL